MNEAISEEEERQAKLAFQKKSKTVVNEVSKANRDEKRVRQTKIPKVHPSKLRLLKLEGLSNFYKKKLTEVNWNR